ncbi:right-handed parallel beta-helix repeat-containing protein [[Eubacterium] cellulosolvens]
MIVGLILIGILLIPGISSIDSSISLDFTSSEAAPVSRARPDEIDLTNTMVPYVWRNDSDVPPHNDLSDKDYGFRVWPGVTLIIYPGVTIDFASGRQLLIEGTLRIMGTSERPVNLTVNTTRSPGSYWSGVKLTESATGYINHTNISYCDNGVNLDGTDNFLITNCTIFEVNFGIKIDPDSNNNDITHNMIYNCDTGIGIYNSAQNIIYNNLINETVTSCISISNGANNNIIDTNILHNSSGRGVSLSGSANNNTFLNNEIYSLGLNGIRCTNGQDNYFKYNQIYSNTKNGIILYYGSERNIIINNTITLNTQAGLAVEGIRSGQFMYNEIIGNARGVSSANTSGIDLENNTIISSTIADFFLSDESIFSSINNTFNSSKVLVYDLSLLFVYWHMFLETRDDGDALTPATVNITNSTSGVIVSDTNITGTLDWIKCLGSIHTSYGLDKSMNPYWVKADNGSKVLKMGFDMSKGPKTCVVKFIYYPPPESTLPTNFEFLEDKIFKVNLSNYFTSSEELEYKLEVISGGKNQYFFNPTTFVLQATPPPNWFGEERLRVTVTANLGGDLSRETRLIVTPVNDAPIINNTIPGFQRPEGSPGWSLNLTGYAMDYDQAYGDRLRWGVDEVNESLLNVTILDEANIHFEIVNDNVFGSDQVKLTVFDQANASDFQHIMVNITPENDPPGLLEPKVMPNSGTPGTYFNFTVNYFDVDGDLPNFIVVKLDDKDSYYLIEADNTDKNVMDGKEYYFRITLPSGMHFFWFECADGYGGTNVTPKQPGPLVTTADKGSLKGYVKDKDTNESLAEVKITMLSLDNSTLEYAANTDSEGNYTLLNLQPGKYQIYATKDHYKDSAFYQRTIIKGAISILDLELEKLPADIKNTPITDVWITVNRTNFTQNEAIEFTGHAEDLDGDALLFYWLFDDDTAPVFGEKVSHTFHDYGLFNITLTVYDTDGNVVSRNMLINVTPQGGAGNGGGGDGIPDGDDTDTESFSPILFLLIVVLIIVIIIIVFIFLYIRRQKAEEELQRQEEEERAHRKRPTSRRKGKNEFVDREKQNVEQVNLIIAKMHKRKSKQRGRAPRHSRKVPISKSEALSDDDDDNTDRV